MWILGLGVGVLVDFGGLVFGWALILVVIFELLDLGLVFGRLVFLGLVFGLGLELGFLLGFFMF